MAFIDTFLKQTAVYWPSPIKDGYGQLTFGTAIEIDCRWRDINELFLDRDGKEALSKSIVHVDQDVELEGYLYLGELTDLSAQELVNPILKTNAYPIRSYKKTPGINANDFVRKAWL
jgi:hypothetical protein